MEKSSIPEVPSISRSQYPEKCLAKAFWVDNKSFIYVGFYCPILQEELNASMAAATSGGPRLPGHYREGTHVIIKDAEKVRNTYARGKVVKIIKGSAAVKCLLIDECREIETNCFNIYPTTKKVLSFTNFCIKGQLKDLECFTGYPFVKHLFQHHLESLGETELDLGVCFLSISNPLRQTPSLEIKYPGDEITFNSILQRYIPSFGKMNYPHLAVPTKMNFVNVSEEGEVWVQYCDSFSLINVVKKLLAGFDPKRSHQLANQVTLEDCAAWKKQYLFEEGSIFLAKHESDNNYHRVKVNPGTETAESDVTVTYIDYGHDGVVQQDSLYPAYIIDQNLCFLPPQSIPIKFSGTKYAETPFKQYRFLKYVTRQPVTILLHEKPDSDGSRLPEGDVLIRNFLTPNSNRGYSLEKVYKHDTGENSNSSSEVQLSSLVTWENRYNPEDNNVAN